jgi:low affinity Fe/Cu permease
MTQSGINVLFHKFARKTSEFVGKPWAFFAAIVIILMWVLSGPFFGFSDTWQLIVNTGTTIVTFLIVFLIQNSQNHDAKAIHLKLDELIKALRGARTKLVDLEEMTDDELQQLQQEFQKIRARASQARKGNRSKGEQLGSSEKSNE